MKRSIESIRVLALAVILAAALSACEDRQTTSNDADSQEVAASVVTVTGGLADANGLGELPFIAGGAATGKSDGFTLPTSGEEWVQSLKTYIEDHLDCATATPTGNLLKVSFGQSCTWDGKRWSGDILITYSSANEAEVSFTGLGIHGGEITGKLNVTRIETGHVKIAASWTNVREDRTIDATYDAEYLWDDEAYSTVEASHTWTSDGVTASLTTKDLVWKKVDRVPETGTITFVSAKGRTWSVVFERTSETSISVTVTGPNGGSRTFDVGQLE